MLVIESIKMALNSLVKNKLRSILTLLGIAIGLFSIIIVMTAIGAIQGSVESAFNSLGTNNFIVNKFPAIMGPREWRKYRNRPDLTIEQGKRLKEMTKLPLAVGISLHKNSMVVKYGNEKTNPTVELQGLNLDELKVNDLVVGMGRDINMQDENYAHMVCVLGSDVADKLFKNIYPIGQDVRIDMMNLRVIGVYEKRGSVLGSSQDNFITIPLSIFKKYYGDRRSGLYTVMASSKSKIAETMDEVIGALRKIRKIPPGKENNFEIITNDQLVEQFNSITRYFRLGAAIVAFIALVAAGVGIMNIMLVSVTERTREIGIRKAIGAKRRNILSQFIIESVAISSIGGILGVIFGFLVGLVLLSQMTLSTGIGLDSIAIGFGFSTTVGMLAGLYPAWKAARMNPIDSLHYE